MGGKRTDVVVRVCVEGAEAAGGDDFTNKTHSLMLRTLSPYFDKALTGDWIEAAERRVELKVASEQEMWDLKMLIKLSYSRERGVRLCSLFSPWLP